MSTQVLEPATPVLGSRHSPGGAQGPPPAAPGTAGGGQGRRRRRVAVAALALGLALTSGTAGGLAVAALDDPALTTGDAATTLVSTGGSTTTSSLAAVAAAVQPSVVSITVRAAGQAAEGSGVIVRSDGLILTSNHVVADAAQGGRITVAFGDGTTATASIVATDTAADLAVIRAEGVSGLQAATLGDSDALQVGDTVLAIGSPLGLEGSVTAGIVSALHRSFGVDEGGRSAVTIGDAVQTDAAINPGNSGGPLVDTSGKVVGISTAIASVSAEAGNIGLGFAIPIDQAKQLVAQLAAGER
jgi:putative serine protease PepD